MGCPVNLWVLGFQPGHFQNNLFCPRETIIKSMGSGLLAMYMSGLAFQRIVPFLLVVPSILYAWIGLVRHCIGKFIWVRSPRSMNFQ